MVSEAVATEPGVRRYGRVPVETLAELYRSAWVFCLPSTYEGFGVPYIEAMAAHTAVVASSRNPGAREVLSDGDFGLLVDDDELGPALTRVLCDAALRERMERRGAERSRRFAWHRIAASYESAFERAIAGKRARSAAS
jgi:glycosyltransferase involved in cell wall biosynthesis